MKEMRIPPQSLIQDMPCDYMDAYSIILEDKDHRIKIEDLIRFGETPGWISILMRCRDCVVKILGLKTSNTVMIARDEKFVLKIGLKTGIFKVTDFNEQEVVFSEDDKHLKFYLSIFLDQSVSQKSKVTATTMVIYNNVMGRIYFFIVKPFHRIIIPALLKGLLKKVN